MIGKVVDRETYLMGREGVRVELYTPRKALLRTAITDQEGKFLFTQLEQEDYIVKVDHIPDEDYVEIVIADDQNRPYALSTSDDEDNEGDFRFRKLPMQEIDMEEVEAKMNRAFNITIIRCSPRRNLGFHTSFIRLNSRRVRVRFPGSTMSWIS